MTPKMFSEYIYLAYDVPTSKYALSEVIGKKRQNEAYGGSHCITKIK